MRQFREFGIKTELASFTGEKISISKILNREINVLDYKVVDSKYKGKCLYIQIEFKDEKRVVFTGSKFLLKMIEEVPKAEFPFKTTIIEEDERYEFS